MPSQKEVEEARPTLKPAEDRGKSNRSINRESVHDAEKVKVAGEYKSISSLKYYNLRIVYNFYDFF